MDARQFLEAVWPETGIYCLALPFTPPGATRPIYAHVTFENIADAAAEAERLAAKKDVFFSCFTLKEHKVWNETKTDPKTGELGAWEYRTHSNMAECRCFFFDLDVEAGNPKKYDNRQEALDALEQFLFTTQLPSPLITSSGGGFHVYWLLNEPIAADEWRQHAARLRHAAQTRGLRADPARTTDVSSVLRVVGTFNHKRAPDLRPVEAISRGARTDNDEFVRRLEELTPDFEPLARDAQPYVHGGGEGNLSVPIWNGPISTLDEV